MKFAASFLEQLQPVSALVVGDLMLDRYVAGDISRISPEAPVMILEAGEVEDRSGGAAAVANYLRTFGAEVTLAGAVGHDEAGDVLLRLLSQSEINCDAVVRDASRRTTQKQRFLGSHP